MRGDDIVKGGGSVPAVVRASLAPEKPAEVAVLHEFLAFGLSGESYALPLRTVHEILKPPPITEVPRSPADVPGIISVRGRIITVVDLALRLRLPEIARGSQSRILLVDAGPEVIGLIVDHVLQVFRLRQEEIEYSPAAGGDMAEYVTGIGRPRSARGVGRVRDMAAPDRGDEEILILLDPVALLKR